MNGTSTPKQVVLIWNEFRDECISLVTLPCHHFDFRRLDEVVIEAKDEHQAWNHFVILAGMGMASDAVDVTVWTDEVLDELWLYLGAERRIINSPRELADEPDLDGALVVSVSLRSQLDNAQTRTAEYLKTAFDNQARKSMPPEDDCGRASPERVLDQLQQAVDLPTG